MAEEGSGQRSKRARKSPKYEEAGGDDDEDDDVEIEDAEPVEEEEEEEAAGSDDDEDAAAANAAEKNDLDDSDDESEDDAVVEARLERRAVRSVDDTREATAGLIEEIFCTQFMCHKRLSVKFNRRINFINGANGSGKSAILAALQLCLGVSAKSTHRGNKMGDLVREGFDGQACVSVTLVNEGSDAFKPEVYGPLIKIERKFARTGPGQLKLYSASGVVVSKDKKELRAVLDGLKVTVDNPVCVLDQENSKKFICGKGRNKYEFFLKATEIDGVLDRIIKVNHASVQCRDDTARQRSKLGDYASTYDAAKREYEEVVRLQRFDVDIANLVVDCAWVGVYQCEKTLEEQAAAVKNATEEAAEAERLFNEAQQAVENQCGTTGEDGESHGGAMRRNEADISRLKVELDECVRSTTETQAKIGEQNKAVSRLTRAVNGVKVTANDTQKDLKRALQELEKANKENGARAKAANDGALAEKITRTTTSMEDKKTQLNAVRADEEREDQRANSLEEALAAKKEACDHATQDQRDAAQHAQSNAAELARLEAQSSSPIAAFGDYQANLKKAVDREIRSFQDPPVGPIGAYVRLENDESQKWTSALEVSIANRLGSWVVTNRGDKQRLTEIARKCGCARNLNVISQPKRPRHKIRDLGQEHGLLTIASIIKVDNDLAFNVLVDMHSIDAVCLFENKDDAEKRGMVSDRGGVKAKQGIHQMLLKNGDETGVRDGNYFMKKNPNNARGGVRRALFGVDVSAAIPQAKRTVEESKQAAAELQTTLRGFKSELEAAKKEKDVASKRRDAARKDASRIENEIRRLKQQIKAQQEEAAEELVTVDTGGLEQEIESYEESLRQKREEIAAAENLVKEAKNELDPLKQAMTQNQNRNSQLTSEMDEHEQSLSNAIIRESELRQTVAKKQKSMDKYKKSLGAHEESLEKEQGRVAAEREKAVKVTQNRWGDTWDGTPPARARKYKSAEAVMTKIEHATKLKDRELANRDLAERDPEVAKQKMERAGAAYHEKETGCKQVEKEGEMLHADARLRWAKLKRIRDSICRRSNASFDNILQKKGASGQLVFNHPGPTGHGDLGLTYQKDNADTSTQISEIASLSGGERSFSTLAMLIALGDTIECPFRVMDEFDVFMDQVSRKIAMKELIDLATNMPNRQFIFITPQDLSSLPQTPILKIFKMHAPIRGQTTLHDFQNGAAQ